MSEQFLRHDQEPEPEFTTRFISAMASIDNYNDSHTGVIAGLNFFSSLLPIEQDPEVPVISPHDEADMERAVVHVLQADELEEMGIKLIDPSESETQADASAPGGGIKPPSSLYAIIHDTDAFKQTLQRLNPTDHQKARTAKYVDSLLRPLASMIEMAYRDGEREGAEGGRSDPDVVAREQLDKFMELVPTLVDRGFNQGGAYELLTEYAVRGNSDCLPEYLRAKRLGLTYEAHEFGPARWQTDTTSQEVAGRWTQALDFLANLRTENPKPFFTEMFDKLFQDYNAALQWVNTVKPYSESHRQYLDDCRTVLEQIGEDWRRRFPAESAYASAQ